MVLLSWSGDWTQTASLSMFISTSICVKIKPYKTLTCAALSFTSQGFCPVFFSAQDHCIEHVASQKTIRLTDPGPLSSHNHTQSQMCEFKMMDGWHSHSPGKRQSDWKRTREKVEAVRQSRDLLHLWGLQWREDRYDYYAHSDWARSTVDTFST